MPDDVIDAEEISLFTMHAPVHLPVTKKKCLRCDGFGTKNPGSNRHTCGGCGHSWYPMRPTGAIHRSQTERPTAEEAQDIADRPAQPAMLDPTLIIPRRNKE